MFSFIEYQIVLLRMIPSAIGRNPLLVKADAPMMVSTGGKLVTYIAKLCLAAYWDA